jgi:hypothetical protein
MFCPLHNAFFGRRVPWMMRPLHGASLGRLIPYPSVPILDSIEILVVTQYIYVQYARHRPTVFPNLSQHKVGLFQSSGHISQGHIDQGTHLLTGVSYTGRIVQGAYRPRKAASQGRSVSGTHRSRNTLFKGWNIRDFLLEIPVGDEITLNCRRFID